MSITDLPPVATLPISGRDPRATPVALCQQTDPEVFFPEKGSSAADAKKVCARCDIAQQCLEFALDTGEDHGVWGGRTPQERRRMRLHGAELRDTA